MSRLYFFAATRAEARALNRCRSLRWTARGARKTGVAGANLIELFVTGVGPAAARAAACEAMGASKAGHTPRPDAVYVIGSCGSLSPGLAEGAVVLYNACLLEPITPVGKDELKVECSPALIRRTAAALDGSGIRCELATGVTSFKVAARREEKLRLAARGAGVVDMESYEIISAALKMSVPCGVLRVVSDSLGRELPDFTPAIKPDGTVDRRRAARIAITSPISTARLILAQRNALRQLSRAIEPLLVSEGAGAAS